MGQKISVYLSDEAIENLDEIHHYLWDLTGVTISRSSALNALLVRGAGLFMDREAEIKGAILALLPGLGCSQAVVSAIKRRLSPEALKGPLLQKALGAAREEDTA